MLIQIGTIHLGASTASDSEIHAVWQDLCVATDELYRAVSIALDPNRELWESGPRIMVDAVGKLRPFL